LKIAILGTRGIPNRHGGFEQFAEYLSVHLAKHAHQVYVYCPHNHPYQANSFKGVSIIRKYDPENKIGTIGQFIYDFNCILDSRKREFDIILQLGYTSSSIWYRLLPKTSKIVTNMDGLEWKRSKYSYFGRLFLKFAEKLAIKSSDFLISDSIGIKDYIYLKYNSHSLYIPYGATVFSNPNPKTLSKYNLKAYNYNMLIARLEPENSIEIILRGVKKASLSIPLLVIGNHKTKYGSYLKEKFKNQSNIIFLGSIYNIEILNNLRYFSNIYFHGHTVGGTNPSLLEAMASESLICANDNIFNKAILEKDAIYFKNDDDISRIIKSFNKIKHKDFLINNLFKVRSIYDWHDINKQYEEFLLETIK